MRELSYPAILAKLKLLKLVYMRNRGDTVLTYKLIQTNILPALFPIVGPNPITIVYELKLVKQSTMSRVRSVLFLKNRLWLE